MTVPRTPNSAAKPGVNPWLVAAVVSMATFMEVLDTSIANVALQHIAGSMGASQSQATWVLTSYLAANAIVMPMSGWFSDLLGRKRFYMTCVALFTLSSLFCGIAPSLGMLLVFRVLQGAGGGGLAPSEQSMLADTFPGKYFGMAFAIYGVAVVVAPAIGPVLGGWITDNFSWRWIFLVNVPVGLLSLALTQRLIQDPPTSEVARAMGERRKPRIDYLGFAFVVLAFGGLQVVLDKGQEADWFGSPFIVAFTVVAALGFLGMILWETLGTRDPVVDLPLLANPSLATSLVLQLVVGFVLNATTMLIPAFTQTLLGYNATNAGLVLLPGGMLLMVMFPLAGRLVRSVQPKYLMALGLGLTAWSLFYMMGFNTQVGFRNVALARAFMCLGLPLFFLPLNTIAYGNLPPGKSNNASAMMNLMRNLGGSIGIALASALLVRGTQIRQVYLSAHTSRLDPAFVQRVNASGGFTTANLAAFYATLQAQAAMLSYLDIFRIMAVACLVVLGIVLFLRRVNKDEAPVLGH
jgi:DHA2 family multidrug resistance protein